MDRHDTNHDLSGMETTRPLLSRRLFAQGALASAGLLVARPALALQEPQPPLGTTAESPMGPFYPLNPLPDATWVTAAWIGLSIAGILVQLSTSKVRKARTRAAK